MEYYLMPKDWKQKEQQELFDARNEKERTLADYYHKKLRHFHNVKNPNE